MYVRKNGVHSCTDVNLQLNKVLCMRQDDKELREIDFVIVVGPINVSYNHMCDGAEVTGWD